MKSSIYYFHVKPNILADFQICISVPLIEAKQNFLQITSIKYKLKMSRSMYTLCVFRALKKHFSF